MFTVVNDHIIRCHLLSRQEDILTARCHLLLRQEDILTASSVRGMQAQALAASAATPWPPALTFFAVLSLYVLTAYPDLTGGDAPELISAAVLGGVPHPPGYPTFCLVSRLFAKLPFGTVARRMNICTAVLGAGAAALLHNAVQRRTGCSLSGATAAAFFAFSPLQWRYSVQADVFGLANFLAAAILMAVTRSLQQRTLSASMVTALVCGLALTNQHTAVFLVLPVTITVLTAGYDTSSCASASACVAGSLSRGMLLILCGAVGLAPYAYLPIAASNDALVSWGDCSTIKGFIRHITRAEYGSQLWCVSALVAPTHALVPALRPAPMSNAHNSYMSNAHNRCTSRPIALARLPMLAALLASAAS
jgi:hypothetical protein